MEKSSIMDYVQKMPKQQLAALTKQKAADPKDELAKLQKLEEAIGKEKEALKKRMDDGQTGIESKKDKANA